MDNASGGLPSTNASACYPVNSSRSTHKDSHAPQGIHLPGTLTLALARRRADALEQGPVH